MDTAEMINKDYVVGMSLFEPGPEREKLQFAESVQRSFGFLVDEFGFRVVSSLSTYVRYEKEDLFINVWHGPGSYAVGVEIGRLRKLKGENYEEWFPLDEVIAIEHGRLRV